MASDQANHRDFAPSYEEYSNKLIDLLRAEAVKDEARIELENRRLAKKCEMLKEKYRQGFYDMVKAMHDDSILAKDLVLKYDAEIEAAIKEVL